jgi:aryl-alcohol dehydrogenase-like predicted oxidoreductase
MDYRFLGRTGQEVSAVSFGPGNNSIEDDAGGVRQIEAAFDLGITSFDTANVEKGGKVEQWLGEAFAHRRDRVFIASKFSGGATRKHIVRECEQSLRRLRTDYIDLYQFHHWQPTVAIEESLEVLTTLVHQGKILYAGCSWFKTYQIANALRAAERRGFTRLVSVAAKVNLLGQDVFSRYPLAEVQEFDLFPFCQEEQLGLIAFRPLAGGLLTGKYRPGEAPPAGARYAGPAYARPDFVELARPLLEVVERLRPLAAARGQSLAQFALSWALSKPAVSTVLVGANTVAQLRELVAAAGRRLTEDELAATDAIRGALPGCVTAPSAIEQRWRQKGWTQA